MAGAVPARARLDAIRRGAIKRRAMNLELGFVDRRPLLVRAEVREFLRLARSAETGLRLLRPAWGPDALFPPARAVRGLGDIAYEEVDAEDLALQRARDEALRTYRGERAARRATFNENPAGFEALYRERQDGAVRLALDQQEYRPEGRTRLSDVVIADYFMRSAVSFAAQSMPGVQLFYDRTVGEVQRRLTGWLQSHLASLLNEPALVVEMADVGVFLIYCQLAFEFVAIPLIQELYGDDADKARWIREADDWIRGLALRHGLAPVAADRFVEAHRGITAYAAERFYQILDEAIAGECDFLRAVCFALTAGLVCDNCIDMAHEVAIEQVTDPFKGLVEDELIGALLEGAVGDQARRVGYGWVPPPEATPVGPAPAAPPVGPAPAAPPVVASSGGGLGPLLLGGGLIAAALAS